MLPTSRQPDQEAQRWDDHVLMYEAVFEPFTLQFAHAAISALGLAAGQSVLDVGAGSGGAALAMGEQGLRRGFRRHRPGPVTFSLRPTKD
jgi:hypothetical protein